MMELVIKIPKEFEEHFKSDRFEDSLSRVASDIECFGFMLAGRYEKETITMLREAFKNGTPLPKGHGRLKDIDAFIAKVQADRQHAIYTRSWTADDVLDALNNSYAPTIIEADGGVEDGKDKDNN